MAWSGVITDAGQALIDSWMSGSHTLTIDSASIGSGTVTTSNMHSSTALVSEKDEAAIVRTETVTGGVKIRLQFGPTELTNAYSGKEIGIWARLDGGTKTLLSLHQDDGDGVAIPKKSTFPDFAFAIACVLNTSNTANLAVTVDTTACATIGDLEDAVDDTIDELAKVYTYTVTSADSEDKDTRRNTAFSSICLSIAQTELAKEDVQTALSAGTSVRIVRNVMFNLTGPTLSTYFEEQYTGSICIWLEPTMNSTTLSQVSARIHGLMCDADYGIYGSNAAYKITWGVACGSGDHIFDPTVNSASFRKKELAEVKATTTGTFSPVTTYVQYSDVSIVQNGNVCSICGDISLKNDLYGGGETNIGTLYNVSKPYADTVAIFSTRAGKFGTIKIDTDGKVYALPDSGASSIRDIHFGMTYIV